MASHNPSILLVDDDKKIRESIIEYLARHGYQVIALEDGRQVLEKLKQHSIDCVVLDVMMPGDDGLTICKKIRQESIAPIIMLSALGEESDRMIGFEVGADDYLPKPFHPRELVARIKALLRRVSYYQEKSKTPAREAGNKLLFSGWELNQQTRQLLDQNKTEIHLTSKEYQILFLLLSNPQHLLTRDSLLDNIGIEADVFDRTIDIHISRLRQKLEDDPRNPKIIKTIRNGGYVLSVPVTKS